MALHDKASAATIAVPVGGDLQAAINAANCGDEIILQAGATFAGNFILRYKGPCTGIRRGLHHDSYVESQRDPSSGNTDYAGAGVEHANRPGQ